MIEPQTPEDWLEINMQHDFDREMRWIKEQEEKEEEEE